jgi:hypothetical protein
MKNQVIKVLNPEHGKKVIQYFKDKGFDTGEYEGSGVGFYYGVYKGVFKAVSIMIAYREDVEIVTLPEDKPNPYKKVEETILTHTAVINKKLAAKKHKSPIDKPLNTPFPWRGRWYMMIKRSYCSNCMFSEGKCPNYKKHQAFACSSIYREDLTPAMPVRCTLKGERITNGK